MSRTNTTMRGVDNNFKMLYNSNMKRITKILIFLGLILFFFSQQVFAQDFKLELNFFYSTTCPHCIAEQAFLDKIEAKYPEVKVNRYPITDSNAQGLLKELLEKHNAGKYFGAVPMNFVGEDFIPGFDNDEGVGKQIENSIQRQLAGPNPNPAPTPTAEKKNSFPAWIGFILIIVGTMILLVVRKKKITPM